MDARRWQGESQGTLHATLRGVGIGGRLKLQGVCRGGRSVGRSVSIYAPLLGGVPAPPAAQRGAGSSLRFSKKKEKLTAVCFKFYDTRLDIKKTINTVFIDIDCFICEMFKEIFQQYTLRFDSLIFTLTYMK
jgi:hypothetical protein